jgi:urea transport system ATP-binding protein
MSQGAVVVDLAERAGLLRGARRARVSVAQAKNTILYLDGITVSFDGFRALNALSLVIEPGELRAIIGPNGAGKTTMMDVITGNTRPDSGTAIFNDAYDLTRLDEADIANLGIGRKFQKPTVFEKLTVAENIELSLKNPRGAFQTLLAKLTADDRAAMDRVFDIIRLGDRRDELAGSLSHGQKQWLEIGMLLSQGPELMLLDEPVAGMTDAETEQTVSLLHDIARDHSVVVVEHDMEFVRNLDCRVTVLHEGSVLAEGSMDTVQNDARVIEVYLGR